MNGLPCAPATCLCHCFSCCTADVYIYACADGEEEQGFPMPSTGPDSTACTSINLPRPDQYISPDLICLLKLNIHLT